jgi:hypothetical protein
MRIWWDDGDDRYTKAIKTAKFASVRDSSEAKDSASNGSIPHGLYVLRIALLHSS